MFQVKWYILFFCTLASALDLDIIKDIDVEKVFETEKLLEKRQVPILDAEFITDIGGPRYTCPPNYQLRGTECHHVDCIFENTQTQVQCLIPATAVIVEEQCRTGYDFVDGRCVMRYTQVVCPQGTSMENNVCVLRIAAPPTITFDFYCPPGTFKDVNARKCIKTAQIPMTSVECPLGYFRSGNVCRYQLNLLAIHCPDGTIPVNNMCRAAVPVEKIRVECPPNARKIGENICELLPVTSTVRCADGSPAVMNRCYLSANLTTIRKCPPNSVERNGKCYIQAVMKYPLPSVTYMCPRSFRLEGNVCVMEIRSENIQIQCPANTYREGDACIYRVDDERNYNIKRICPPGTHDTGNECILNFVEQLTCERIVQHTKCCKRKKCGGSRVATSIHNVNHVFVPTNITSVNINNINIGQGDGCSDKEDCTKKSCVEEEVKVVEKKDNCCTVVTPRVCERQNDNWECGHREYQRCGAMCVQDTIHLKASRPMYNGNMLVMPPPQYGMRVHRRQESNVNCFGCLNGRYDCSPECFEYDCANDGCNLIDQSSFCGTYGGEGCAPADGYY